MKENTKFILRVTCIHVATYILCGIIFSVLFNYNELFQLGNTKYFMRPLDSASSLLGPVFQIARGILFGFVLLLFKESVIETKRGWLKLWAIIAVIGIFNTPGPAPGSIEGIIYTQLPMELHIKGAPEILAQTLLFSYFVATPVKLKDTRFIERNKTPLICAVLTGIMYSIFGIITALILNVDVAVGTTDAVAFIIMFAAVLSVYFASKWYQETEHRRKHIIFIISCYIMLAVVPTIYNYLTNSAFASWISLAINIVPVMILFAINYSADVRRDNAPK